MPARPKALRRDTASARGVEAQAPPPPTFDAARDLGEIDEAFMRKVLVPYKLIRRYCRVTVEGLDHVPGEGPAILAANHTGWLGLDYANLAITVHDSLGRIPRGVVHPLWFTRPKIADAARRLGLVPAAKELMVELLRREKLVIIFPEAEQGAFKPTATTQYKLLEFKRGFVRVAMTAGVPIIPVAILGGEEANPVLSTLPLTDQIFRLPLPLPRPRNLLPYPVKWRISFLAPIPMKRYSELDASDHALVHKITLGIRRKIQTELGIQMKKRGNKYW